MPVPDEQLTFIEQVGGVVALVFCVTFFAWYIAAAVSNRRRLMAAAGWLSKVVQPLGGPVSTKWAGTTAFHLAVSDLAPPFKQLLITVLLKPRDMVSLILTNRLLRRRDLVIFRCELPHQPIWGLEVYRPRTLLSGLAHREIEQQRWEEHDSLRPGLRVAHGGGKAAEMYAALLDIMGDRQDQLWRLSVRRQSPHLLLAIDMPELAASPSEMLRLLERLAEVVEPYSTV